MESVLSVSFNLHVRRNGLYFKLFQDIASFILFTNSSWIQNFQDVIYYKHLEFPYRSLGLFQINISRIKDRVYLYIISFLNFCVMPTHVLMYLHYANFLDNDLIMLSFNRKKNVNT